MLLENNSETLRGWSILYQALYAQRNLADELLDGHQRRINEFEPTPKPEQKSKAKKKKNKKFKGTANRTTARNKNATAMFRTTQQNNRDDIATAQSTAYLICPSAQPEPITVVPPKTTIHAQKTAYSIVAQLNEYDPDVIELRKRQKQRQQDINDYNQKVMDEPGTCILRDVDGLPVLPSKDFRRRGTSERQQMRNAGY
jgi:hypothetical protein